MGAPVSVDRKEVDQEGRADDKRYEDHGIKYAQCALNLELVWSVWRVEVWSAWGVEDIRTKLRVSVRVRGSSGIAVRAASVRRLHPDSNFQVSVEST